MNNGTNRIWVTTIFAQKLLEKLEAGSSIKIQAKNLDISCLKGLDFISVLKSKPLVKFLNDNGVENAKLNDIKFTLLPGDELYVINPSVKLHEIGDDEEIPLHTSITITKYTV